MEIEYNQNSENLKFKELDNVTIAINLGGEVDIEIL